MDGNTEKDEAAVQPRKRSWFRFHLSTALVIVLTAGVLLWANLASEVVSPLSDWGVDVYLCGWPKKAHWIVTEKTRGFWQGEDKVNAALDACVALSTVGVAGLVAEFVARRRSTSARNVQKQTL